MVAAGGRVSGHSSWATLGITTKLLSVNLSGFFRRPSQGSITHFVDSIHGVPGGPAGTFERPEVQITDATGRVLRFMVKTPEIRTGDLLLEMAQPGEALKYVATLNYLRDLGFVKIESVGDDSVVKLTSTGAQIADLA